MGNEQWKSRATPSGTDSKHYFVDVTDCEKLPLRPWDQSLLYIFGAMKRCGDGLAYFDKKRTESLRKLVAREGAEHHVVIQHRRSYCYR